MTMANRSTYHSAVSLSLHCAHIYFLITTAPPLSASRITAPESSERLSRARLSRAATRVHFAHRAGCWRVHILFYRSAKSGHRWIEHREGGTKVILDLNQVLTQGSGGEGLGAVGGTGQTEGEVAREVCAV